MDQKQLHCRTCNRSTLGTRPAFSNLIHFLITFCSCGLWGIPWIVLGLLHENKQFNCTVCGEAHK
jgi:hypothetical protein